MALITWMQSTTIFLYTRQFGHGDNQTNEKPGDAGGSLPLTSEKAVFCKNVFWALP